MKKLWEGSFRSFFKRGRAARTVRPFAFLPPPFFSPANRLRIERIADYTRARLEATVRGRFPQYPTIRTHRFFTRATPAGFHMFCPRPPIQSGSPDTGDRCESFFATHARISSFIATIGNSGRASGTKLSPATTESAARHPF